MSPGILASLMVVVVVVEEVFTVAVVDRVRQETIEFRPRAEGENQNCRLCNLHITLLNEKSLCRVALLCFALGCAVVGLSVLDRGLFFWRKILEGFSEMDSCGFLPLLLV